MPYGRGIRPWVNIQFKGHFVSFGYSERIYVLCESDFFLLLSYGQYDKLGIFFYISDEYFFIPHAMC